MPWIGEYGPSFPNSYWHEKFTQYNMRGCTNVSEPCDTPPTDPGLRPMLFATGSSQPGLRSQDSAAGTNLHQWICIEVLDHDIGRIEINMAPQLEPCPSSALSSERHTPTTTMVCLSRRFLLSLNGIDDGVVFYLTCGFAGCSGKGKGGERAPICQYGYLLNSR